MNRDLVDVATTILARLDLEAKEKGPGAQFPCAALREDLRRALTPTSFDRSECLETRLPSGYTLFVQDNGCGGRSYWSDEVGCGVLVWDTCLVSVDTLRAAMESEVSGKLSGISG